MSAPNGQAGASSGWQVTSQVETSQVNGAGQVVNGVQVGFVTGHGVHGSVFVPLDTYRPDVVRAQVAARAADLDAVAAMSAPAGP